MTRAMTAAGPRPVRAPRGTGLRCRGWHQEAALRMLMNNLDPEVAEDPDRLVVYGGSGRAARSWECFDAIVAALEDLENDETLCVQSGKPVGVFRTHPMAPRGSSREPTRPWRPSRRGTSAGRWRAAGFLPEAAGGWAARSRWRPS